MKLGDDQFVSTVAKLLIKQKMKMRLRPQTENGESNAESTKVLVKK